MFDITATTIPRSQHVFEIAESPKTTAQLWQNQRVMVASKWGAWLLVLFVVSACNRPMDRGVGRVGSLRGANILLVSIDTLRQDRVGSYGNRSGLTPNLDRLSAGGVRYTHAFTPVPLTLPA